MFPAIRDSVDVITDNTLLGHGEHLCFCRPLRLGVFGV